jgi:hypothetical protein
MPYHLDWLDEARRILKLQIVDPLDRTELEALQEEVTAVYNQPGPLYLLADLSHFSWGRAQSLGDEDILSGVEPRSDFAMALLGTGAILRWLVNRLASRSVPVPLQAFEYEDRAYAWLSALADDAPSPGAPRTQ